MLTREICFARLRGGDQSPSVQFFRRRQRVLQDLLLNALCKYACSVSAILHVCCLLALREEIIGVADEKTTKRKRKKVVDDPIRITCTQSHDNEDAKPYQNVNDHLELDIPLHTLMHQVPDDENIEDSESEPGMGWLDEEGNKVTEKRNTAAKKKNRWDRILLRGRYQW